MENTCFEKRRTALASQMRDGDIFVLFSGDSETISILPVDSNIVNRNFYYLTGLWEPNLVLMIQRSGGKLHETLFIPAQSEMEQFYMGKNKGPEYYNALSGISDVDFRYNLDSAISMITCFYSIQRLLIACPNKCVIERPTLESCFVKHIKASFPHIEIVDMNYEIMCMRQFKDDSEIMCLQRAVDLTGMALHAAMTQIQDGMTEAQARAICDYTVRMNGGEGVHEAVIAAGKNACILHYDDDDGVFRNGELGMLDLCVKYHHYVSDITRVFPVGGKFTERQAYWYNVCLTSQEMIVRHMRPSADLRACGEEARAYVAEELIKNGYIYRPEELPAMIGRCRTDFAAITGVNHSIGLDADETGCSGNFTELQPNMVYTVEPGIYLGSEGIGVRVEDDFLVTTDGVICLSANIPKTVEAIEKVMESTYENIQCIPG